MPMPAAEIERLIKASLPDAQVEIIDLAGDDDHFSAIVTSREFTGLSKLKQHQLVYKALGQHMGVDAVADPEARLQLQTLEPAA